MLPRLGLFEGYRDSVARAEGSLRCPASAAGEGWDPHYRHQPEYVHVASVWPPGFLMAWWQGSKDALTEKRVFSLEFGCLGQDLALQPRLA